MKIRFHRPHTFIVVSFLLILSPIVSRMVQVPIEMFDYLVFEIPSAIFALPYILWIILHEIERLRAPPDMRHGRLLFILM